MEVQELFSIFLKLWSTIFEMIWNSGPCVHVYHGIFGLVWGAFCSHLTAFFRWSYNFYWDPGEVSVLIFEHAPQRVTVATVSARLACEWTPPPLSPYLFPSFSSLPRPQRSITQQNIPVNYPRDAPPLPLLPPPFSSSRSWWRCGWPRRRRWRRVVTSAEAVLDAVAATPADARKKLRAPLSCRKYGGKVEG